MISEEDIIAMLDKLTKDEVSRIKITVNEETTDGKTDENADAKNSAKSVPYKEYHHGRCDVGSPWARGCAFDVLEDEE